MYQSFTGATRRPRDVNLSGRRANPFAAVGSNAGSSGGIGSGAALAQAQAERASRQKQRQELAAAQRIQRTWRGHTSRKGSRAAWRAEWDRTYGAGGSFTGEQDAAAAMRLLLTFARPSDGRDRRRVEVLLDRIHKTVTSGQLWQSPAWISLYLRMEALCLQTLKILASEKAPADQARQFLGYSTAFAGNLGQRFADVCRLYYKTMAVVYSRLHELRAASIDATKLPFAIPQIGPAVYDGIVSELLVLPMEVQDIASLSRALDAAKLLQSAEATPMQQLDVRGSLWLLGQLVHIISEKGCTFKASASNISFASYIHVVGQLLARSAEAVDVELEPVDLSNVDYDIKYLSQPGSQKYPLNTFLKRSLATLIDQTTIRRVLNEYSGTGLGESTELATYVLNLLRVFYNHADDIRMWLYLGNTGGEQSSATSPIAYFWREARKSKVVTSIIKDTHSSTKLILNKQTSSHWQPPNGLSNAASVADDWKVVLIFLELYTFVLKLMDDEEFLGHVRSDSNARSNPLSIAEVADLVVFLKHLGFALYYYAKEIRDDGEGEDDSLSRQNLSRHFGTTTSASPSTAARSNQSTRRQPLTVARLPGVSIQYVKGLTTGLVRSIYERDSRRSFLPKGHWLMTSEFDMSKFISDVVTEEESRHQLEDADDDAEDDESEDDMSSVAHLNSNLQRMAAVEKQQRAARRASKRRYLESVAPRLEILQHMPFIIPFDTRVQIFREFVRLDQVKRRYGHTDPDIWRQTLVMRQQDQDEAERQLNRHHAKVRRKHEFEDAMEHFYQLGSDLKEPIQITFVDEFDIIEAGIDGGGVTKEFLTSATSQAFHPQYNLFETNQQHLLYPKPTAVDELKERFREAKMPIDGETYRLTLADVLSKYEFAGRIIGKCLYEGILVDISFAGFFLVKWALTGASGLNTSDSAYRPNINDLRDLDESFYQGLRSLKNYRGDVQDLALTFSVTDEVSLGDGRLKTIERELQPRGADTPVTNKDRLLYISRIVRYRLQTQSAPQTNAFLKGLASIIRPSWLSMFNQSEIQNLVGGATTGIDVEDLRRNTVYGGVYVIGDDGQEHPSVQLFWRVMKGLSDEDKGKVLKFVTSTPRAPLLGFGSLTPNFAIRDSGGDESRFPTTSTCINLLKLPRYGNEGRLREKLLYAINSGAGFDLS